MQDEATAHAERLRKLTEINRAFFQLVPHNMALGMELVELGDARATMRLPWNEKYIGNPETRVLHGGVITTLMDACCGAAVFQALRVPQPIATLDLRIDYLRPATPDRDVLAQAHCFKVTKHVAFVRGFAFHDNVDDPIAHAAGTFMLSTAKSRTPRPGPGASNAV